MMVAIQHGCGIVNEQAHGRVYPMVKGIALSALAALAVIGVASVGAAHADGLDPIAMRKVGMDLEAGAFRFIRSVLEAKGDVKTVESSAKAIARWQSEMVPNLFPAGSDKGDTKALPEIWSDRAGFEKYAAAAAGAATRLAAAAKAGDADAVGAEMQALGKECGGCHRAYRAR
jgi:cytochrome c556